jgi:hypothetical protein
VPEAPPAPSQDVDLGGSEDESVKVDEGGRAQPRVRPKASDDMNSFFFEDEVEKKGKDQKGDNDSFWE